MRVIDRLYQYIEYKGLSAYAFERSIDISNGYLGKQFRTAGGIGSEILEKIYHQYIDLSLIWLITGEGKMILPPGKQNRRRETNVAQEDSADYIKTRETIDLLKEHVGVLKKANADQQKIIEMLEKKSSGKKR
jgi:hypothetical protein